MLLARGGIARRKDRVLELDMEIPLGLIGGCMALWQGGVSMYDLSRLLRELIYILVHQGLD